MNKSLAIIVTSSPLDNKTNSAYELALASIKSGIEIAGIFFYQDGVFNASKYIQIPADENQMINKWQLLNQNNNVALHLCATAAEKRGLIHPDDDSILIHQEFTLSGLGELVILTTQADKVVQL